MQSEPNVIVIPFDHRMIGLPRNRHEELPIIQFHRDILGFQGQPEFLWTKTFGQSHRVIPHKLLQNLQIDSTMPFTLTTAAQESFTTGYNKTTNYGMFPKKTMPECPPMPSTPH
eukprot:scaffold2499_cov125-Cylindrotheca_fusiformis.AAC.2